MVLVKAQGTLANGASVHLRGCFPLVKRKHEKLAADLWCWSEDTEAPALLHWEEGESQYYGEFAWSCDGDPKQRNEILWAGLWPDSSTNLLSTVGIREGGSFTVWDDGRVAQFRILSIVEC